MKQMTLITLAHEPEGDGVKAMLSVFDCADEFAARSDRELYSVVIRARAISREKSPLIDRHKILLVLARGALHDPELVYDHYAECVDAAAHCHCIDLSRWAVANN